MYSSSSSINMTQENNFKNMILSETSANNTTEINNTMSINTDSYNKTFDDIVKEIMSNKKSKNLTGGSKSIKSINSATSTYAESLINKSAVLDSTTSEGIQICE